MENNLFTIVLSGDFDSLNINTVKDTLSNFDELFLEIKNELCPEIDIEVKVKSFNKGSIEIPLLLNDPHLQVGAALLFSHNFLQYTGTLISTITNILKLKKFLKGDMPTETNDLDNNSIQVKNNEGDTTVVSNKELGLVLNNCTVQNLISNTFYTLERDQQVLDMKFKDSDNKEIAAFNKEDFRYLAKETNVEILENNQFKKTIKKRLKLKLFKPAFEPKPKHKWDLFYNNDIIHALIDDDKFFEKVLNRKVSFKNGDSLECDLQITSRLNSELDIYQPERYDIIKVHRIHHIPKQNPIKY